MIVRTTRVEYLIAKIIGTIVHIDTYNFHYTLTLIYIVHRIRTQKCVFHRDPCLLQFKTMIKRHGTALLAGSSLKVLHNTTLDRRLKVPPAGQEPAGGARHRTAGRISAKQGYGTVTLFIFEMLCKSMCVCVFVYTLCQFS